MTALVMKETLCGSVWAYELRTKSVGDDPWVAEQLVDDLRTIGLARERVIVKSHQEASIVELLGEVAKREGMRTMALVPASRIAKLGIRIAMGRLSGLFV